MSLKAREPIVIDQPDAIATSFPSFVDLANGAGLQIRRSFGGRGVPSLPKKP